jgi:DNA-binding GntR family transcriptional regulator
MSEQAPTYAAPRSLADQAYDRVEELIVTLALPPGHLFSESDLSEQIGIGRTPLREALQRLASEGMVRSMPRLGMQVTEIDATEYLDLLATRGMLDTLLAEQAAHRASPAEREALLGGIEEMILAAHAGDEQAFIQADRRADILMDEAAGNPWAARASGALRGHCRRFWMMHRHHADMAQSAALHGAMLQQVVEGNTANAGKACNRLIAYLTAFAKDALNL